MIIDIIPLLTTLSAGSLVGIFIKSILDRNSEIKLKLKTINEEKYRTILIYMSIVINPQNKNHFVLNDDILYNFQTDIEISNYALSKLKEYYYQTILYGSDDVMRAFKAFIIEGNRDNYILAAQKMRASLWGYKTKLTIQEITF